MEPLPINPELGVPGFPDCVRDERAVGNVAPEFALNCSQKPAAAGTVVLLPPTTR